VTLLQTKKTGNILAPTYQVYASGAAINDDKTWCQLRAFLASREYTPPLENPGRNIIPNTECGICYSVDHMRGLCPFPEIPNWKGPRGKYDPPLIELMGGKRNNEPMSNRNRTRD
jgi:hypothetical protein